MTIVYRTKTESCRDHFDQKVETSLRRDLPIITTPHAKHHLAESKSAEEAFTAVHDLDFFQDMIIDIKSEGSKKPAIKVTGMPGKHVPPGVVGTLNDLANAVSSLLFSRLLGQVVGFDEIRFLPPTAG